MAGGLRRHWALAAVCAVVAASCSNSGGNSEVTSSVQTALPAPSSTARNATTTAPAVTLSAPSTTVGAVSIPATTGPGAPATTAASAQEAFPDALAWGDGSSIFAARFGIGGPHEVDGEGRATNGPDGSGCSPGTATLPDGVWLVGIEGIIERSGVVSAVVDLMCQYSGPNALAAYPDDDFEDSIVVNEVAATRTLIVAEEATFHPGFCFFEPADGEWDRPGPALDATTELLAMAAGADRYEGAFLSSLQVWLVVRDGSIVEVFDAFYHCAG